MVRRLLCLSAVLLLCTTYLHAQNSFNVSVTGTTSTQAVLTYVAPADRDCTIEASESAKFAALVHDTDAALFPGANSDHRATSVVNGRVRVVVLGGRTVELGVDNRKYSRALQANTLHHYRVACGTSVVRGTFTTANTPPGHTYSNMSQPADALAAPSNLAATTVTDGLIMLAWTPGPAGTYAGFEILRDGAHLGVALLPYYPDTTADRLSTHVYTVKAYDSSGNLSAPTAPLTIPGASPDGYLMKSDVTTSGSWTGVYGADGAIVIGDVTAPPAYVTVTPSDNLFYVWASSSTDARALQKFGPATDRISACWYTAGSMSVDLNFNDAATHRVAMYMLDWDGYNGGRAQKVELLDVSGAVISTRTVTNFSNGQYLVWNLSGHVVLRVTNTNSNSTAVVTGLFFDAPPAASVPAPASLTAASVTATAVSLTWTSGGGATAGYRVYRDGALVAMLSGTAYTDTTVAASTSYSYTVAAYDASGASSSTTPGLPVTTPSANTIPVPAPKALLWLRTLTGISLSWTSGGGTTAGFRVYRDGVQIAQTATTAYSDKTVTVGATYAYTVAAYDANGNLSSQTPAISVTVAPPNGVLDNVQLSSTSVTGGSAVSGSFSLTWPAGRAGMIATITSSDPAVTPQPASITLASTDTGQSFTLMTNVVATETPVTISVTYRGVTKTATLTLLPAGAAGYFAQKK